ncbi:MAG: hypothetical protein JXA74_15500 [Anaerolineae bacterium]|nr:hypothetical protein [Anaerolineae bacterium]
MPWVIWLSILAVSVLLALPVQASHESLMPEGFEADGVFLTGLGTLAERDHLEIAPASAATWNWSLPFVPGTGSLAEREWREEVGSTAAELAYRIETGAKVGSTLAEYEAALGYKIQTGAKMGVTLAEYEAALGYRIH